MWVGADPGGINNFGVALLAPDGTTTTRCVSSADEAAGMIDQKPLGVGVDAPLWWSSGRSSDRQADQWIRRTYGIAAGTVQTANSLKGAALVQAVMFVDRLRRRFPTVPVTEAHPKALLIAQEFRDPSKWPACCVRYAIECTPGTEHERDAVIAAVAAREGFEGRWQRDLAARRHTSEQDPGSYWLAPVHYFWPE